MQKIVICNTIETVEKINLNILLRELCQNTGFLWPIFSRSYHTETSPLICYANQWTGFYVVNSGKNGPDKTRILEYFTQCLTKMVFFHCILKHVNMTVKEHREFFLLLIIRLFIDRDFHCQLFILKMVKGKLDICRKNCQAINWETNCFEKGMSTLAKKQFAEQKGCFGRILSYWYFDSPSFYPEVQVKNKTTLYLNLLQ